MYEEKMRLSFRTAMKNNNEEQSLEVGEIPAEMNGLRMTKHRKEVYSSLLEKTDHPTATEVFDRVHQVAPTISLATVYNCLEALVSHDLVQQVNFDREPSRYCSNLKEHGHFHDKNSGVIHDVTFKKGVQLDEILDLPAGAVITDFELTLRGKLEN